MYKTELSSTGQDTQSLLEETQLELGTFLYRASHELKGPLARMEGLIQLMGLEENHPPETKFSVRMLETLTKQMQGVVNELIHMQGLIQGKPQYAAMQASWFIQKVQTLPEIIALAEGGEVQFSPCEERIFTDPELVQLILKEVLKNALENCQEGKPPQVTVEIRSNEKEWVLAVKDQGTGMEPALQDKMFDPFFVGKQKPLGTGMGLYYVRKAVNQLAGTIVVESAPGLGTRLQIRFPQMTVSSQ